MYKFISLILSIIFFTSCSQQDSSEYRLNWVSSLFSGADQTQKFNRVYEYFPTSQLFSSKTPLIFENGSPLELPIEFKFQGKTNFNELILKYVEQNRVDSKVPRPENSLQT